MQLKKRLNFLDSRKGVEHYLYFNIFEFVLVAVVMIALMDFVSQLSTEGYFEKQYLVRDTALLINTIYASPGNLEFIYNEQITNLNFDWNKNAARFYENSQGQENKESIASYPFAIDKKITMGYNSLFLKNCTNLTYTKKENEIKISE